MKYNRDLAVSYALDYALSPNPNFIYIDGNDCTNFISQCLRAGGANNDYNSTHPWWYNQGNWSICWAVAHSLFWYIRVTTEENRPNGIQAQTYYIYNNDEYYDKIMGKVQLGDIIQYKNFQDRIQHSAIITGFDDNGEPLICQHTYNARNITWRKNFKQTIFHHITRV